MGYLLWKVYSFPDEIYAEKEQNYFSSITDKKRTLSLSGVDFILVASY